MSTRSGRIRTSAIEASPPRTRPSRSPARMRKTSPSLKSSPARKSPPARQSAQKSPSRKSPSRKSSSKFPARKSPARTTKQGKEAGEPAQTTVPKSPVKRPALKSDVSVKLEDFSARLEAFRSTRSKRIEYSVKDVMATQSEFAIERANGIEPVTDTYGLRNRRSVEDIAPRRSSRLRDTFDIVPELPDIRRSLSKSLSKSKSASKSISKSVDTYSDEEQSSDDLVREKSKSVTRKLSTPLRDSINNITQIANRWEFGGRLGSAALMILIPLTVLSIHTSCLKSCSIQTLLNFSPFKNLTLWFSIPTAGVLLVQIIIQAIFTILPILGPKADRMDETGTTHCFNAFFSSIFSITLLFVLDFYQIINKNALLDEYLVLATTSYIFAVILSIVLYVKSLKLEKNELNSYGNTGYILYDFFMGREIHPHFVKLDVKIWISRICNINVLILSMLIFTQGMKLQLLDSKDKITIENYKELLNKVQLQPTILVFSMMQIIYALSFILKEHRITSTFYWHSEGLGYLQIVSSALYPFFFTTISKYVADTDLSLPTNILISASILYVLGYCIMLVSNNIKYEFRRNPLQPGLANLNAMPTFHGNKLLTSGLWGILRHPNYAGDILIHTALSLPGLLTGHIIAASPALITILVLLYRAWRDHARCNRRYGAAWQRYCKRVPSVIVPKVL